MKINFNYKKTNEFFDFKRVNKSKLEIVTKKGIIFEGKKFVSVDTGLIIDLSMVGDKELINFNVRPISNLSILGVVCFEIHFSDYKGKIVLNFFNFDDRLMRIPENTSIAEMVIGSLFEIEIVDKEQTPLIDKIPETNVELVPVEQKKEETIKRSEEGMNLKTIFKNIFGKKEDVKDEKEEVVDDETMRTKYRVDIDGGMGIKIEYLKAKNERAALINFGRLKKKYPGCVMKLNELDEKIGLYKEMSVKEKKDKPLVDESKLKTFIITRCDNTTGEVIEEIEVKGKDGRSANAKLMGLRKKEPGFRYGICEKEDEC